MLLGAGAGGGDGVPTRKELAAETTLAEKNPINNKTIKDGNGTALALSSFLCRRGANLRGA
jgi:hypothetical protein